MRVYTLCKVSSCDTFNIQLQEICASVIESITKWNNLHIERTRLMLLLEIYRILQLIFYYYMWNNSHSAFYQHLNPCLKRQETDNAADVFGLTWSEPKTMWKSSEDRRVVREWHVGMTIVTKSQPLPTTGRKERYHMHHLHRSEQSYSKISRSTIQTLPGCSSELITMEQCSRSNTTD